MHRGVDFTLKHPLNCNILIVNLLRAESRAGTSAETQLQRSDFLPTQLDELTGFSLQREMCNATRQKNAPEEIMYGRNLHSVEANIKTRRKRCASARYTKFFKEYLLSLEVNKFASRKDF